MPSHYNGTDDEIRALNTYIKLMRATNTIQTRLERRLAISNLTENQFGTLEMIYHLGAVHQHVLSQKLFTSKGNVTVLVDRLEKRGLVRRERSTDDHRLVSVHLTDAGRNLVETILPEHVTAIVELISVLKPKEQENLATLCKKLGVSALRMQTR